MAKRGRKPVPWDQLDWWERQWYMAFHHLAHGKELPHARYEKEAPLLARERLKQLRELSAGRENPEVQDEIERLENFLTPRKIAAQALRRKIWVTIYRARSVPALKRACKNWKELPDVRSAGMACWPVHVMENAQQFLAMKKRSGVRFPRSRFPAYDDSRINCLARGMAGIFSGVSPLTAIERLRNLRHEKGGPLWNEKEKQCECWRCWTRRAESLQFPEKEN